MLESNRSFLVKIQRCFVLLFKNDHQVNDDTLLQKFSSLLESIFKSNDDESEAVIVKGLQLEVWLDVLTSRWKLLEPGVVAFGINVIALLPICSHGVNALEKHRSQIKHLLESIESTSNLSTTIRFALWKLYQRLITVPQADYLLPKDCLEICIGSLNDDSMYVSRAAKELAVQLLLRGFHDDTCCQTIHRLVSDIQQYKRHERALVALDVLLCVLRGLTDDQVLQPEVLSQLNSALLVAVRGSDDERLVNECCNVMLTSQTWSKNELETDEVWLEVFNNLCDKRLSLCCSKFITATSSMLIRRERHSRNLISMLMYPLHLYCGKPEADIWPWDYDGLPTRLVTAMETLYSNNRSITKLLCYIISSLIDLHTCFTTQEEKLALVKILLYILSDNQPTAHLVKVSQVTADALVRLLDLWVGESWSQQLKTEDHTKLILDSMKLLDRRPSQTVMSVRLTKLVLKILTYGCSNLQCVWDCVGVQLKQTIELRCHDPQWETRDSAFELMAGIAALAKNNEFLQVWLKESCLVELCISAFDDLQDYVKASAISVLASVPEIGFALKSNLVQTLGHILLLDSEGIVRRAAANNFMCWLSCSYLRNGELELSYKCMVRCCHDLDWEVKLSAVQFWNIVLTTVEQMTELEPRETLKQLTECGFYQAVSILLGDEDSSVQHEVAKLLVRLQKLVPESLLETHSATVLNEDLETKSDELKFEMPTGLNNDSIIESVLDTIDHVIVQNKVVPYTSYKGKEQLDKLLNEMKLTFPRHFLTRLKSFGCGKNSMTTDLYELNPESLLDDIITGNNESDHEEDIIIDCY